MDGHQCLLGAGGDESIQAEMDVGFSDQEERSPGVRESYNAALLLAPQSPGSLVMKNDFPYLWANTYPLNGVVIWLVNMVSVDPLHQAKRPR